MSLSLRKRLTHAQALELIMFYAVDLVHDGQTGMQGLKYLLGVGRLFSVYDSHSWTSLGYIPLPSFQITPAVRNYTRSCCPTYAVGVPLPPYVGAAMFSLGL